MCSFGLCSLVLSAGPISHSNNIFLSQQINRFILSADLSNQREHPRACRLNCSLSLRHACMQCAWHESRSNAQCRQRQADDITTHVRDRSLLIFMVIMSYSSARSTSIFRPVLVGGKASLSVQFMSAPIHRVAYKKHREARPRSAPRAQVRYVPGSQLSIILRCFLCQCPSTLHLPSFVYRYCSVLGNVSA